MIMKKHTSMTAVGCALCIAAVGAFTGCSKDNSADVLAGKIRSVLGE